MKTLGIIPARGGSKGVTKKNIRLVDGEPLIYYAIKAAQESLLLTNCVVTTDDDAIIEVVKKYNCNFQKRDISNAQDNTPIEPVITEVLEKLNKDYELIILLQPTAPIRTGKDIDNVIEMFKNDSTTESVVSVIELNDIHPARMYTIDDFLKMLPLNKMDERKIRQDLTPVYLRNGCIYAVTTSAFYKENKLITNNKKAYVMPESMWANIDTERDLLITEVLVKEWRKGKL
ncbi:acylneuraminate cytidylyltransferase family protein [Flavicella sp.]|uniref:acylneuraminate cytidylyltransferase family protein n=1 Tax=Flavicella sp. TaxID=2957742 RepID=UPI003019348D